ncbi:MAG: hypothetical protein RM022_031475 [Nostoc sp. EfeVER01]|uniref:hypothetical protein n=1 Tax=unclassified Nostoc TaxID=2593658 RepID=UPI002AD3D0B7|nr:MULTISPECIES: hypothetical protein [unclassified Nostoc]MDZ7945735.1 hypothetical protein [Nostoc sp. EfeVER01]MDZ7994242.1 hypothetical protein [Nostoc sp. EspVER01]
MLDIVLFALTSSPANLPMSPSINEVRSVAMSNVDGFTPNDLLQQIYGTQVLDEDVDLELSDEELESVIGQSGNINGAPSDVFFQGNRIIDYSDFLRSDSDPNQQLNYICNRLPDPIDKQCCLDQRIPCPNGRNDRNTAEVIRQQLVSPEVKRARGGFDINLQTGQLTPR